MSEGRDDSTSHIRSVLTRSSLRESVVRERFEDNDAPGLNVAFVRVFRLELVWRFPDSKASGGCRRWVQLPEPPPGWQLHPSVAGDESGAISAPLHAAGKTLVSRKSLTLRSRTVHRIAF